jgi:hypothetical protein
MKVKDLKEANRKRDELYESRKKHAEKCKSTWTHKVTYAMRLSPQAIKDPAYKNVRYKATDYENPRWFDHLPMRWNHDDNGDSPDSTDIFTNTSWRDSSGCMNSLIEANHGAHETLEFEKRVVQNVRRGVSTGTIHMMDEKTGCYVLANQPFEFSLCSVRDGPLHVDCQIWPHSAGKFEDSSSVGM